MPLINVPVGIAPCQIDDFPKIVGEGEDAKPFERSCKGALFIRPASTKVVTQDELDWIKGDKKFKKVKRRKEHKLLARRLVVVRVDIVTDKSDRSRAMITEEARAKAEAKTELREKGVALPMTGPRAEFAVKVAAEAKVKAAELVVKKVAEAKATELAVEKAKAVEPKSVVSESESVSESSGESGGSRSSRRRRGGN